jgi:hypothetical protein
MSVMVEKQDIDLIGIDTHGRRGVEGAAAGLNG